RRYESQPVGRVIALINLILRGGANYYSFGQSGRCFGYVRDWVERGVIAVFRIGMWDLGHLGLDDHVTLSRPESGCLQGAPLVKWWNHYHLHHGTNSE
ncbi:hypothetical protein C2W62_53445, partial [Candidatus Entotheonella serta]